MYLIDFINIIQFQGNKYQNIDNSLKLLEYLGQYNEITNSNLSVLKVFLDLLKEFNLRIIFTRLLKEKDLLKKNLDLIKILKNSEEFLEGYKEIKKSEIDLKYNKTKLNFLNEDYTKIKNQNDKIKNEISNYNLNIQSLNEKIIRNQKEIHGIINGMNSEFTFENEETSKSGRIQMLQGQIRNFNYEIKQNLSKLDELQTQIDKITPKLEILKKDYKTLNNLIENISNRIVKNKSEVISKLNDEFNESLLEFEWSKTPVDIKKDLKTINNKIESISETLNLNLSQDQLDLTNFIEDINKIEEILFNKQDELKISYSDEEIKEVINNFRELENLIKNLEEIINKFLIQINLKCSFNLITNEDDTRFKIQLNFIRTKDTVNFTELTTPKKIFLVITFYLSIKILLNDYNIIFSNIFLPDEYNKRGSVYRTIRKVLPVFKTDNELKDFNLIFIISNLEMKKPIENIKIINIDE